MAIDIGQLLLASASIDVTECDSRLGTTARRLSDMSQRGAELAKQNDR